MSETKLTSAYKPFQVAAILFLLTFAVFKSSLWSMSLLFIVFLLGVLFALKDVSKRFALLVFLGMFFLFLVGKDFVHYYFVYGKNYYSEGLNIYSHIMVTISLIVVLVSYYLFENFSVSRRFKDKYFSENHRVFSYQNEYMRNFFELVFWVILGFSILSKIHALMYVQRNGYAQFYSGYGTDLRKNTVMFAVSRIEIMLPLVFAVVLSAIPTLKNLTKYFVGYITYLILSLFTGQRGGFGVGLLTIVIYLALRKDVQKKVKENKLLFFVTVLIMSLLLIALFSYMGSVRLGSKAGSSGYLNLLLDFFDSQGISITTIKNGYIHAERFPSGRIYTLKFLTSGIFGRLFSLPIFPTNSIENALNGYDFSHTLSYFVLGERYLKGFGVGSSYIAESLKDGGIIYLIIVSIIYGKILSGYATLEDNSILKNTFLIIVLPDLLWAPRGAAFGFMIQLTAPSTMLFFFMIFIFRLIVKIKYENIYTRNHKKTGVC